MSKEIQALSNIENKTATLVPDFTEFAVFCGKYAHARGNNHVIADSHAAHRIKRVFKPAASRFKPINQDRPSDGDWTRERRAASNDVSERELN